MNEAERIHHAVTTVGQLIPDTTSQEDWDAHCRWQLREVFKRIRYSDLTVSEIISILAIVGPVHSRVIRSTAVGDVIVNEPIAPVLRIVD